MSTLKSRVLRYAFPRLRYRWHLERLTSAELTGWAYRHDDQAGVLVQVEAIDGRSLGQSVANEVAFRIDGRCCGFTIKFNPEQIRALAPGRFTLRLDGVRVANTYFFSPFDPVLIEQELDERNRLMVGLKLARLQAENAQLLKRIVELEARGTRAGTTRLQS